MAQTNQDLISLEKKLLERQEKLEKEQEEIKSLRELPEIAFAQVLSYLKATGLKRALLINFGEKKLIDGIRRISL